MVFICIRFQNDEYIDVKGIVCNLKPNTVHGLHVHKFGEIRKQSEFNNHLQHLNLDNCFLFNQKTLDPNCTSTLGHFNPYKQKHGPHKNERIEDRHLGMNYSINLKPNARVLNQK